MLGAGGEGGLNTSLSFALWHINRFGTHDEALAFFEENKGETDGHIHPEDDYQSFVIFTRKENE